MSRIEDDHQANRAAERVALEKRQREQRAKEKAAGDTAFSKLVAQSQAQKTQGQKFQAQTASESKQLHEEVRASQDSIVAEALEEARRGDATGQAQRSANALTAKLQKGKASEERGALAGRAEDQSAASGRSSARSADAKSSEGTAHSRRTDQAVTNERLQERSGDNAGGAGETTALPERGDRGALKAGRDSGKGSGQGQEGKEPEGAAAGFRLNPALMAPAPLAQPKDSSASARLRALANEIAQKIVERVRVGTNAAGHAEFQIDLRSNVLSGLSIKISGSNGKIRALFAGSDRQVLKLLRDQSEGLKTALQGRGLTLEELKIEERA